MRACHSPCMRDGPTCKGKWNQLIPDYKRIADFHARTGRNAVEYWELSSSEHSAEGLPKTFSQELYDQIHEWFGQRPQIQPPHIRDLLAPDDANHPGMHALQLSDDEGSRDSHLESDNHATMELSDSQRLPSPVQSLLHPLETPSMGGEGDSQRPSPSPARSSPTPTQRSPGGFTCGPSLGRTHFPPSSAQAPIYISSSDTSEFSSRQPPGNTGVRRKLLSSHNVIADATKASGEVMAMQMRDMVAASQELERSKIEVQLKLFSKQMEYQREKDRRLYESSLMANENARLAILKQGEVVSCLSQLSSVLQMGLHVSSKDDTRNPVQAVATGEASQATKSATLTTSSLPSNISSVWGSGNTSSGTGAPNAPTDL
jgi:hypothetical protein